MKKLEKSKFDKTCDCCSNKATHFVDILILCKTCMGEIFEQMADAIKED